MFSNLFYKISAERTNFDHKHPPFFYQQQRVYSFCEKFVKNKIVLEVGSGSGFGAYRLSKTSKRLTAIDQDEQAIKESKKRFEKKNLMFINSNADNFLGKFDVVISLQVMEHIPTAEVHKYVETAMSNTKKGGYFIASTPNRITSSYNENPYHYKEYTFEELQNILSTHFKKIEFYSVVGDLMVSRFEKERKEMVLSFFKKDVFKLRRLIPRRIKQTLFDLVTFQQRKRYENQIINIGEISEKNYAVIKGANEKALDLIAVCQS